jgi:phage repressor protein C with HTH and peptisase S24 domain
VDTVTKGKRIEMAMQRIGIDRTELARRVGRSQPAISQLISGSFPGKSLTVEVAAVLEVPPEWLTVGDNPPAWTANRRLQEPSSIYSPSRPGLSVVGIAAAGDHDQAGAWQRMRDPEPLPIPDAWEAVQVRGDSAYPVAFDGQFVLIDTARAASGPEISEAQREDLHNDIVLVQTTEHGEEHAYIKRFCRDDRAPAGFIFASINAGWASPYLPTELIDMIVPVVGVVFEDPRHPRIKGRNKPPKHTRSIQKEQS